MLGGVRVDGGKMDVGAGTQSIMFGYASNEPADCMPSGTLHGQLSVTKPLADVQARLRRDCRDPTVFVQAAFDQLVATAAA